MTKLRRDSFGNHLCFHCGGALDAQMACRMCTGHVGGKPLSAEQGTSSDDFWYALMIDETCECGHHVCSCPAVVEFKASSQSYPEAFEKSEMLRDYRSAYAKRRADTTWAKPFEQALKLDRKLKVADTLDAIGAQMQSTGDPAEWVVGNALRKQPAPVGYTHGEHWFSLSSFGEDVVDTRLGTKWVGYCAHVDQRDGGVYLNSVYPGMVGRVTLSDEGRVFRVVDGKTQVCVRVGGR